MPRFALPLAALAMFTACTPAPAQTYDPAFPFCMHVFGDLEGERMDCVFSAWNQCTAAASGRAATCVVNPYYTAKKSAPGRRSKQKP